MGILCVPKIKHMSLAGYSLHNLNLDHQVLNYESIKPIHSLHQY